MKSIKKYSFADEIIIPAAGLNKRFLSKNIKILKFLIKLEDNKVPMIEFIKKYLKPKKKNYINYFEKNKKFRKKI